MDDDGEDPDGVQQVTARRYSGEQAHDPRVQSWDTRQLEWSAPRTRVHGEQTTNPSVPARAVATRQRGRVVGAVRTTRHRIRDVPYAPTVPSGRPRIGQGRPGARFEGTIPTGAPKPEGRETTSTWIQRTEPTAISNGSGRRRLARGPSGSKRVGEPFIGGKGSRFPAGTGGTAPARCRAVSPAPYRVGGSEPTRDGTGSNEISVLTT